MDDRLLSVDEVAQFLGVKRDTVYKLISRRGLPGRKVGRLWKFRRQEVDDWVNAQPAKNASHATRRPNPRKGAS
jgi:excisionase family DNA binding protein